MSGLWVKLLQTEMMLYHYVASASNVQSLCNGWKPAADVPYEDAQRFNWGGRGGEMAVCKALNKYYLPIIGNHRASDSGPYQVRTNTSRKHTDTRVMPSDLENGGDDKVFIGVLDFAPWFYMGGWIYGRDAKQDPDWYRHGSLSRPKCYWVPLWALNDFETLPELPWPSYCCQEGPPGLVLPLAGNDPLRPGAGRSPADAGSNRTRPTYPGSNAGDRQASLKLALR